MRIYQIAKLAFNTGMKTIHEIRRSNLITLKHEFGTYAAIASLGNTDPSYLSQIVSLNNPRNMGDDLARNIEIGCKKPYGWMDQDHSFYAIKNSNGIYEVPANTRPAPEINGRIPLISYVQAGRWREIMEHFEPDDWIETTLKVSQRSFALRVVGDSMTNPFGAPSIPDGYIIIVDPMIEPKSGLFVVARLEDSNEAVFKQLIIDGPHHYLKSLNPDYKPIYIDDSCIIVGVVKKSQFDL